jgi:hypothetical protein
MMLYLFLRVLCLATGLFALYSTAERTTQEAAMLARKLVQESKLGQLATIMSPTGPFPDIDGKYKNE